MKKINQIIIFLLIFISNNYISSSEKNNLVINKNIKPQKLCANCSKEKSKYRCANCELTVYCSANCQKQDWTIHKQYCDSLKKYLGRYTNINPTSQVNFNYKEDSANLKKLLQIEQQHNDSVNWNAIELFNTIFIFVKQYESVSGKGNYTKAFNDMIKVHGKNFNPNFFCSDDNGNQSTLLIQAIINNHPVENAERILIDSGANIDLVDYKLNSPLIHAIKKDKRNIVALLLKAGASIHKQNYRGLTPLMVAIKLNKEIYVRLLLTRISDLSVRDINGNTALHYAIKNQNLAIINLLFNTPGLELNIQNNLGYTPLMLAVKKNLDPEVIKTMLKFGADPDIEEYKDGDNALLLAFKLKNITLATLLLEADAMAIHWDSSSR